MWHAHNWLMFWTLQNKIFLREKNIFHFYSQKSIYMCVYIYIYILLDLAVKDLMNILLNKQQEKYVW